jgi:hypothetical protein
MDEGLLIDDAGRPTTDPRVLWHKPYGAILPFGEHKGWALSMMCEIVGGALSGGGVQDGGTAHPMLNNMTTFVADPSQIGTADALPSEIAALARWVRASPAAEGAAEPISLPGEPSAASRQSAAATASRWRPHARAAGRRGRERRRRRAVTIPSDDEQSLCIARRRRGEEDLVRQAVRPRVRVPPRAARTRASWSATTPRWSSTRRRRR